MTQGPRHSRRKAALDPAVAGLIGALARAAARADYAAAREASGRSSEPPAADDRPAQKRRR